MNNNISVTTIYIQITIEHKIYVRYTSTSFQILFIGKLFYLKQIKSNFCKIFNRHLDGRSEDVPFTVMSPLIVTDIHA